ncbi:hypothetical protein HGRIS_011812 [Hohenbuehelia grisea]|uniref:GDP/GTP exchange factor Sec2 N-terminal domain-containing protein n=1 Tax=Hohenbuehelia grisea TaxID=104357 RepID=A0ABR3JYG0_9AGAR
MADNPQEVGHTEAKDPAAANITPDTTTTDSAKPTEGPQVGSPAGSGSLGQDKGDEEGKDDASQRPESPPYETPVSSPPLAATAASSPPLLSIAANVGPQSSKASSTDDDPDAQAMVISSLRTQILELSTQVTQLNTKLIRSYDRVSDLEDTVHASNAKLESSSSLITTLQAERSQHLSALDTGLLVEKAQVTAELTRLMEKATEEATHRGQAESKQSEIEKELDDLSANLFEQANGMVRQARGQQAISERKAREAEEALKETEEAVRVMQQRMQELQAEKNAAEASANNMKSKGKWVDLSAGQTDLVKSTRLLSSHAPYTEFLMFVAHLRSIRPSSPAQPNISTLLPLPFLTRLLTEDSEPTVRLDLAPSLNWLSRRSVLAAIHSGQLTIEPMSTSVLLNEAPPSHAGSPNPALASYSPSLSSAASNILCALCGVPIFPVEGQDQPRFARPPTHPTHSHSGSNASNSSWSASLFKRPLSNLGSTDSPPPPPPRAPRINGSKRTSSSRSPTRVKQVYIFKLAAQTSSFQSIQLPISLPLSRHPQHPSSVAGSATNTPSGSRNNTPAHTPSLLSSPTQASGGIYPLCTNGWCLTRLRATCTMWAFVRSGIVDRIWEEEIPSVPLTPTKASSGFALNGIEDDKLSGSLQRDSKGSDKPPIPPRRRGLWGMASALGASWSGKDKPPGDKTHEQDGDKKLPPPPPSHPTNPHAREEEPTPAQAAPPPLPKRSNSRRVPPPPPESGAAKADESVTTTQSEPAPETNTPAQEVPNPIVVGETKPPPATFENPPLSPRFVALPESRPGTPTRSANRRSLLGQQVPSRSSSPAPGANTATGAAPGGAPPPLPRRAAARVRGVGDAGGSRPGTPAPAPTSVQVTDEAAHAASTSDTPAVATTSGAPDAPAAPVPGAPAPEHASTEETAAQAEVPVPASDAPSPANGPELKAPLDEVSSEKADGASSSDDVLTPGLETGDKGTSSVDVSSTTVPEVGTQASQSETLDGKDESTGIVEDKSKVEDKASIDGLANGHVAGASEHEPDVKSGDTAEEPPVKEDESGAPYVGDATWEERTWKEIVRLREDMFWARIGAFR